MDLTKWLYGFDIPLGRNMDKILLILQKKRKAGPDGPASLDEKKHGFCGGLNLNAQVKNMGSA